MTPTLLVSLFLCSRTRACAAQLSMYIYSNIHAVSVHGKNIYLN
jgi:hypothetical protein